MIKLRELIHISIEIVNSWLGNYWWAGVLISYSLFLKISNSYGNQIAGYLDILVEVIGWEIPNLISLRQLHSTHFHDIRIFDSNIGGIGGLDCRCVLKWGHWPAVDGLALSEHVPHYLGSCLLLSEPGHGLSVCVGLVSDRQRDISALIDSYMRLKPNVLLSSNFMIRADPRAWSLYDVQFFPIWTNEPSDSRYWETSVISMP